MMYCQLHRIELAYLRGRAALARVTELAAAKRTPIIAMTRRCVRALRREQVAWAAALAETLDASLALLTASREHAIAGLLVAAGKLEAAGLGGFAGAVRWQLRYRLGHESSSGAGGPGYDATVIRPDRLAHTLAPLPLY
jgi:hypothetical protein